MNNYEDYTTPKDTGDSLAKLSVLANEQVRREGDVARAEEALVQATSQLRDISEVAIPELMAKIGIETFKTTNGINIDIKETIRASILKAKQAEAFSWLRENGHEALIKRVVKLQFGMGEDVLAQETLAKLDGLDIDDKSSVHASTLAKFVRENLEEGRDVPEELFSVHKQRVSKVKV